MHLVQAFPIALQPAALDVAAIVPESRLERSGAFTVWVTGELVTIPYRLYGPEPESAAVAALSSTQRTMLQCLHARHHNGYVRQRYLCQLIGNVHPWVAAFVVQLIGEYVVEIVIDIHEYLVGVQAPGSAARPVYGGFAAENPKFLELTYQRARSYWNCYHRAAYAARRDYPAFEVLESLSIAADESSSGTERSPMS